MAGVQELFFLIDRMRDCRLGKSRNYFPEPVLGVTVKETSLPAFDRRKGPQYENPASAVIQGSECMSQCFIFSHLDTSGWAEVIRIVCGF